MPPQPELPVPAHDSVDNMLTRKFGREVANYFSGSQLNRLSFLRTDSKFLSAAFTHPSAQLLLLNSLSPLAHGPSSLAFARRSDVTSVLGSADPYALSEEELISAFDSRTRQPQLVFLGLDESYGSAGAPGSAGGPSHGSLDAGQSDATAAAATGAGSAATADADAGAVFSWMNNRRFAGRPYFALDVTPAGAYRAAAEALVAQKERDGLVWLQGRTHMNFPAEQAAIYAEARSLADWNARNPFCAGCGLPTLSVNAGFKRTCPPTDRARLPGGATTGGGAAGAAAAAVITPGGEGAEAAGAKAGARPACATRGVVSNLSFPRTDPTIIVAVISADSKRILLGRGRRFPPRWYSTLAGFVEPAESVEEAVRREVWEEAGIALGRVQVHSTQPWPYPASLMIGAVAQALPGGEDVRLDNDPELEDARWYGVEEVREALKFGVGSLDEMDKVPEGYKEGGLRLPPKTAIANRLITAVVEGYAGALGKL